MRWRALMYSFICLHFHKYISFSANRNTGGIWIQLFFYLSANTLIHFDVLTLHTRVFSVFFLMLKLLKLSRIYVYYDENSRYYTCLIFIKKNTHTNFFLLSDEQHRSVRRMIIETRIDTKTNTETCAKTTVFHKYKIRGNLILFGGKGSYCLVT